MFFFFIFCFLLLLATLLFSIVAIFICFLMIQFTMCFVIPFPFFGRFQSIFTSFSLEFLSTLTLIHFLMFCYFVIFFLLFFYTLPEHWRQRWWWWQYPNALKEFLHEIRFIFVVFLVFRYVCLFFLRFQNISDYVPTLSGRLKSNTIAEACCIEIFFQFHDISTNICNVHISITINQTTHILIFFSQ